MLASYYVLASIGGGDVSGRGHIGEAGSTTRTTLSVIIVGKLGLRRVGGSCWVVH